MAISDDGSVVVGQAEGQGFIWTRETGMTSVGQLEGTTGDLAWGVSGDGKVVVGSTLANWPARNPAFYWTQADGIRDLESLVGNNGYSTLGANSASYDGSVIVGHLFEPSSGMRAYRWTHSTGFVSLGSIPEGGGSLAYDVSGDGSVVVGDTSGRPFRWTEAGGIELLPFLGPANAISQDGTTIVGGGREGGAIRWTASGGAQNLGSLAGVGANNVATGVSADGSVVVGFGSAEGAPLGKAFIWDSLNGMRSLDGLLQSEGVDLQGWQLIRAVGVSANGDAIAGYGINPKGQWESWIATIPEPNGLRIFSLGVFFLFLGKSKAMPLRRFAEKQTARPGNPISLV